MNLPQTNFKPPFNITRASHLVLTVRDLAASRAFYTEVIGLLVTEESADTLYLRGVEETCHHSLTLKTTSAEPACERIGFRVFTEEDLEQAKAHFDKLGLPARWADVPYQARNLWISDSAGTPIELCSKMKTEPRLNAKIHQHKGAGARRMDHYQVLVPDVLGTAKFYTDLGFRISDYLCMEGSDQPFAMFLYRKDNPWDVVLLTRPGPRFHHCGYVIESMNDMIRACDVAANLGLERCIEHGPARHGATHSYFLYLRDPDGHRVELLLPAIQLIDLEDTPMRYEITATAGENGWGPSAPQSWVEDASPFVGVAIKESSGGDIFSQRVLTEA